MKESGKGRARKGPKASRGVRQAPGAAGRGRPSSGGNRSGGRRGRGETADAAAAVKRLEADQAKNDKGPGVPHRSGTVSVAGRPNAGKSTLVNALVGEKVAIVAPTAQTTRTSVRGIANLANAQVVFTDTPGIHKSDSPLNRRMMDTVRAALEGQDVILFVADATRAIGTEDEHAVNALRDGAPCVLALNKIDRIADKRDLLPLMEQYSKLHPFTEVFAVSAKAGEGLQDLLQALVARLPEGPALFPSDQYTDQPERFLAAEFIRERVLHTTRQEVPHAVAVLIDEWEVKPRAVQGRGKQDRPQSSGAEQITRISATILVERPGQKKILIGKQGALLKRIGTEARLEIEKLVGGPVYLALFVRVEPNWRESADLLDAIDWRSMVGSS